MNGGWKNGIVGGLRMAETPIVIFNTGQTVVEDSLRTVK